MRAGPFILPQEMEVTMKIHSRFLVMATLIVFALSLPCEALSKDELKISRVDDLTTLDPAYMGSVKREFTVMNCIFNGLVKFKEGTWDIVPDLSESWQLNEDNTEIVFHLRQGVKFHKGYGEMTSEDVKYSFERIIDPKYKSPEKGNLGGITKVEEIDKYTLKVYLDAPNARLFTSGFPMEAGFIVSKKAVNEMGRERFGSNPVGTGPYEFVSWEPKKKISLKAFDDYWGRKPPVKKISFIPIADDVTNETALKTGEIDIGRVPLMSINRLKKNPNLEIMEKPQLRQHFITMTFTVKPTDDVRVRRALAHIIDIDKIIEAAYFGVAKRNPAIMPPGTVGYWNDAPGYDFNPEKAKDLLIEAGYKDGIKVTLSVYNDTQRIMAEIIKADAAKANIEIDIRLNENTAHNEACIKGTYNMCAADWGASIDAGYTMVWFKSGNKWNFSHWKNKEFDHVLEEARREMDVKTRGELYVKAQKIMYEKVMGLWLTNGVRAVGVNKSIDCGIIYPSGLLAPWTMSFK
jgi:peptide/nickel transport system substrate-binding protein